MTHLDLIALLNWQPPAPLGRADYARAQAVQTVNGRTVSSRSKTGDPACSAAVSEWKRNGQPKGSAVAKKLAECRAKSRGLTSAKMQRAAGNEGKAGAIERRIAQGKPVTIKDRLAALKAAKAQRAVRNEGSKRGTTASETRINRGLMLPAPNGKPKSGHELAKGEMVYASAHMNAAASRPNKLFHEVETIGENKGWIAEIKGTHPKYGFDREFVGNKDYSRANKPRTRGVYTQAHLEPGKLYEVNDPRAWGRVDRYFATVENGAMKRMDAAGAQIFLHRQKTALKPVEPSTPKLVPAQEKPASAPEPAEPKPRKITDHKGRVWSIVGESFRGKTSAGHGFEVHVAQQDTTGDPRSAPWGVVTQMHRMGQTEPNTPISQPMKDRAEAEAHLARIKAQAPKPAPVEPKPEPPKPAPAVEHATPRAEAEAKTKAQLADDSDYKFARPSAVPNAGEDLAHSARHVRNAWRGIEDAERTGTADKLIKRDSLLKLEPMNLSADLNPMNSLATLGAHLAVKAFKPAPILEPGSYAKSKGKTYDPKELRQQYYDAFKAVKEAAEQAVRGEVNPYNVVSKVTNKVSQLYREAREKDSLSPHAEMLRQTYNTLIGTGKSSPKGQMREFGRHLQKKYQPAGGNPTTETLVQAKNHVADMLEGKSMNESFGVESKKKGAFNPADLYNAWTNGVAKRVGGRSIPGVSEPTVAAKHLTDAVKMRGLQFGNSMTDAERKHHLRETSESLADLADVTGLPDHFMSLNGTLGLAFGARGKGTALAHYEPDLKVINLTRMNGVGTLAHEWGHAFDHFAGGGGTGSRGGNYLSENAQHHTTHGYEPNKGNVAVPVAKDDLNQAYREWQAASMPFRDRARRFLQTSELGRNMTDERRQYFNSLREIFARSFENHVSHKLETQGRQNTYLTAGVQHDLWPTKEESAAMAPAFDRIFAAFKAKHASPSA